jgi:hypothetical protein
MRLAVAEVREEGALNNQSLCLGELGCQYDALRTIAEAGKLVLELPERVPHALPDLGVEINWDFGGGELMSSGAPAVRRKNDLLYEDLSERFRPR